MSTTIHKKSDAILQELGIVEPYEIDMEAIAEHCGATIIYDKLEGCEARIVGTDERAIITVNSGSSVERQRFSGGHELGHWIWHRGRLELVSCTKETLNSSWSGHDREVVANQFAADLLLPEFMFRLTAKNKPITFCTVRELASNFKTSLTATAIRLVDNGYYPGMVVCVTSNGRRWFRRGPDVPSSLWPRKAPGKYTKAIEIIHGSHVDEDPIEIYADSWIEHGAAHRYTVIEDSIKIPPDTVLTLLWWKDQSQINDLYENDD